ncbi:cytochrome P450 [Longimicrobium sp.]|uniref:cytochrome P450 n=1 Tax=Longimicrobium sp. TaxID=2029185 RepID=UPI003B3BC643
MSSLDTPDRPTMAAMLGAYQAPHALYDRARAGDGVAFDPAGNCWLVTDHRAVRSILEDRRFTSDLRFASGGKARPGRRLFIQDVVEKQIVLSDGAEQHGAQRVILQESSRKMQELSGWIRELAAGLLEPLRPRGAFDLVGDFSLPYALQTVCRVFGIPVDDPVRVAELASWSSTMADLTSGYLNIRIQEITLFGEYFRKLVAARRASPSDDLVSSFLTAGTFAQDEDLVINCMAAFAAGRVTSQKLIGDGVPMLFAEWATWRQMVAETPGVSRRLTEELLRMITPTRYVGRHAIEDVDLSGEWGAGHVIRAGQRVILFLEAANRDPARFPDPHELKWERQPNPHVAFGHGPHRCPGASIARAEIQIALETLLATFETLGPNPSAPPVWDPNPNLGGYRSYPCLCS